MSAPETAMQIAARPADPRDVALDRAVDEIEREVGHLNLHQRIIVARAIDQFGDAVRSLQHECDW
jgi:hypothetical protein